MQKLTLSRNKKVAIALVLLLVIGMEIYAQTYVTPNYASVIPQNNAKPAWFNWKTPGAWLIFGNYTFNKDKCMWLVQWCVEEEKQQQESFLNITICKTGENSTYLGSPTGIVFSSLRSAQSGTPSFSLNTPADTPYNDKNTLNYKTGLLFFGCNQMNLDLTVNFYEETLLGIIPLGQQIIPIQATLN